MREIYATIQVSIHTESKDNAVVIANAFVRWIERELHGIDSSTDGEIEWAELVNVQDHGTIEE